MFKNSIYMKDVSIGQAKRYRVIIDYINKYKPNKVLEIGSGSQGIGRCYNIKFDGLDLTTSDYGKEEKKHNKNMNFIQGSALNIPIKEGTYDFVFFTDMLEHIKKGDREKVFSEAIRVCKKGGYVLFLFPCGFFAKVSDRFLYIVIIIISLLLKKNIVPGWLKEHLNLEFPRDKDIDNNLLRVCKYSNVIKNYKIHNFINSIIHSLLDFTGLKLKQIIIDKTLNRPGISKKSFLGVRKLILIQK